MTSGINYLAVLVAALAAWAVGFVWYEVLWKGWLAAQRESKADLADRFRHPRAYLIFVFVVELIMARILAEIVGHAGDVTVPTGLTWAVFCWLGLVAPVMVTENFYLGRTGGLGVINLGHWLVVLLVMGAIIGIFGA